MHLTTAFTLLAGTVASVSAAALVPKDTSEFTLTAQNPGTVIHDRALIASQGRLWLSRAWSKQDASCKWDQEKPPAEGAILFLKGDELFLYGGREESHQQLALDPKEDGLENLKYFDNTRGIPSKAETKGWRQDGDIVSFMFALFQACPIVDGWDTYRVDLYANPSALDQGCITFEAKAHVEDKPLPCMYTPGDE